MDPNVAIVDRHLQQIKGRSARFCHWPTPLKSLMIVSDEKFIRPPNLDKATVRRHAADVL